LAQSKAFVDTTILAEVLLKTGPTHDAAERALLRYTHTLLPVYAIKEWKRGQFAKYVYIHNQLKRTGSFSATNIALSRLFMRPRWQSTAFEAVAVTTLRLPSAPTTPVPPDTELADRFRLAFKTLIYLSWDSRRSVTSETVMDLDCYVESGPRDQVNGEIDIHPRDCRGDQECCLAKKLRKDKDALLKLRNAIPPNGRQEDARRREALKKLAVHQNSRFERRDCQALGDAYFALFAPMDADILTTNVKDHVPLAAALGKTAVAP
jgi:hypothetical protein